MGEVERFVNDNHLYIDCWDLQANTVLPEILLVGSCLYIALFNFHLCQYSKLKCLSLHLILDCQSETVCSVHISWDRVWDNADSFHIPIAAECQTA